ncbi:hypothetical protein [Candidatus Symbiobacter mobilis]|uniref:Extracellular protein n=1 Tax=Candidatus Symbiobacter mobilis CR TaxID=946483 RepID=U5N997_9BURK|nr:hypothetical protein [Candidatus Symbiobacter mobilis]AGX87870.1 extracellular protein [Candidatus Symbiobacter mobilis CR]
MKKWLMAGTVALCAMLWATGAYADDFKTLRAKMTAARESLVVLATDKTRRGADQQKIVKDTAAATSALLAKLKAPPGKEAQFQELVETWGAFKKTRETELVPLILAGQEADALKLAGGIQKERINKCFSLLTELGG